MSPRHQDPIGLLAASMAPLCHIHGAALMLLFAGRADHGSRARPSPSGICNDHPDEYRRPRIVRDAGRGAGSSGRRGAQCGTERHHPEEARDDAIGSGFQCGRLALGPRDRRLGRPSGRLHSRSGQRDGQPLDRRSKRQIGPAQMGCHGVGERQRARRREYLPLSSWRVLVRDLLCR